MSTRAPGCVESGVAPAGTDGKVSEEIRKKVMMVEKLLPMTIHPRETRNIFFKKN